MSTVGELPWCERRRALYLRTFNLPGTSGGRAFGDTVYTWICSSRTLDVAEERVAALEALAALIGPVKTGAGFPAQALVFRQKAIALIGEQS